MFGALLVLAAYLPFQLALNPSAGIDLASIRVLILALAAVWAGEGLRKKRLIFSKSLVTFLVISFLFLSLLSSFVARNQDWAGRKLLFLFSIFPVYFVAAQTIQNKEQIFRIVKALVVGGAAAAGVSLAQFFSQFIFGLEAIYKFWAQYIVPPFLGKSFTEAVLNNPSWLVNVGGHTYLRATAVFPDPHMFSFFLGLLLPLAVWLAWQSKKISWWMAAGIILTADLLTFSRGGYLGIFVGLLALAVYFWKRIGSGYKIFALALSSLLVIGLVVPSPISMRFGSIFNLNEGSNKGRLEIWRQALTVIQKHPWLGVGIGNYPLEIKPTADYREPIYAHSTYLDIAAETGLINLAIWISILFLVAVSFYQHSRENYLYLGLFLSLLIFSVHALVETPIYSPTVLTLLLLILSLSNLKVFANEKA